MTELELHNEEEDVLWKKNKSILKNVIAYVDVWDDFCMNYSEIWREKLEDLGAKVQRRLTKTVTHVIYKDGQEQIKKKAIQFGCHLVSVLWIAEVEATGSVVDETRFPFTDKPTELKPKRFRNMVDEETIRTPEKKRKAKFIKTLRQRRESVLDETTKKVSEKLDDLPFTRLEYDEESLETSDIAPISVIHACETPMKTTDLRNRMAVPNTQPANTPKRHDDTLTTVIPETPPELRTCPQSTKIDPYSFHLNISNLSLEDTQMSDQSNIRSNAPSMIESPKLVPKPKSKRRSFLIDISPKKRMRNQRKSRLQSTDNMEVVAEDSANIDDTKDFLKEQSIEFHSPERTTTSVVDMTQTMLTDYYQKSPHKSTKHTKRERPKKLGAIRDITSSLTNIDDTCECNEDQEPNGSSSDTFHIQKQVGNRRRTRLSVETFIQGSHHHIKSGPMRRDVPSLVVNAIREKNRNFIISTIDAMGGLQFITNVKHHTTHCITPKKSRTKQVIRALAIGAWILPYDYIKQCAKTKKWVSEESFQLDEYAPRSKRLENNSTLFKSIVLFVSPESRPQQNFLQEVIEIVGGRITHKSSEAQYIIGPAEATDKIVVAEKWILDSLSGGERLDYNDYLLLPS